MLKNLVVFISPVKGFIGRYEAFTKIFIDNSISLGWNRNDILLVTNFPWEYNGVKAIEVSDEHYIKVRPRSLKTAIIPYLIDQKIITAKNLYWNHDVDAFQAAPFTEKELNLEDYDCGLTDYGWRERWCLGSFFVKKSSCDIFAKAKPIIESDIEDETALMQLTQDPEIASRCKRLNITYNFGMRHIASNWEKAEKPLKVIHFAPDSPRMPTLNMFMYGDNEIKMPLMDSRLRKIFKYHRIK